MHKSPLEIARAYREAGFYVVPVPRGKKAPALQGWQHLRIEEAELSHHFSDAPSNIGLLLGASGIVDVDLDSPEARALAPAFLPATTTFGRPSAPRSHLLYRVAERRPSQRYQIGSETLVEYRDSSKDGTPLQTILPPSEHPTGEVYSFDDKRDPLVIDAEPLTRGVARLAAASALARLYPRTAGARHDVALALASVLLRSRLSEDEAREFIKAVARHAGDGEVEDRAACVASTSQALAKGEATTGLPRLRELLCADEAAEKLLQAALGWLGFTPGAGDAAADRGLREAGPESRANGPGNTKPQSSVLLELIDKEEVETWHDTDGDAFVTVKVDGHLEHHGLRSLAFSRWLSHLFYRSEERAPGRQVLEDALGVLEGRALFEGPQHETAVRVAEVEGTDGPVVYLDLGTVTREVVEVVPGSWSVIDGAACPVRFMRSTGMLGLPTPVAGGDAEDLRALLNLDPDGHDLVLLLAWLAQALRGSGPYPILALSGEQGSGKSTAARFIRGLLDPNKAELRTLPRTEQEAFIAASRSHVQAYDNVSGIAYWLSDMMCRLCTGGGYAVRQLYTTDEEHLFEACRPQIVNGITEIIERPDLAERTLSITLPRIEAENRRTEAELNATYEEARPRILGFLLDAVAAGLARLSSVTLERPPRLADFAQFATACEEALGFDEGAFLDAYEQGQAMLAGAAVSGDIVAEAIIKLFDHLPLGYFRGTATDLLDKLNGLFYEKKRPPKGWPSDGRALSGRMRRLAPSLRAIGIEVEHGRTSARRTITLKKASGGAASAMCNPGDGGYMDDENTGPGSLSPPVYHSAFCPPSELLRLPGLSHNDSASGDADDADDGRGHETESQAAPAPERIQAAPKAAA